MTPNNQEGFWKKARDFYNGLHLKVIGSSIGALLLGVTLIVLCFCISTNLQHIVLSLSVVVLGFLLGWTVGLLATPYQTEKIDFKEYKKNISVFISGYLLSKIDQSATKLFSWEIISEPLIAFRVISFISAFLISLLVTFVYRHYASNR